MGADAISTLPPLFFKPKTIGKVLCLLLNFNKSYGEHYGSARILEVVRRKYKEYKSDNNQRFNKKVLFLTYSMYVVQRNASKCLFVREITSISNLHAFLGPSLKYRNYSRIADYLLQYCKEVASVAPDLPFYYYHVPIMTGVQGSCYLMYHVLTSY